MQDRGDECAGMGIMTSRDSRGGECSREQSYTSSVELDGKHVCGTIWSSWVMHHSPCVLGLYVRAFIHVLIALLYVRVHTRTRTVVA